MAKDRMTIADVRNVLRAGAVTEPEFENGSWRYRVATQRMAVIAAFREESVVVVVTAWRFR